MDKLLTLLDIQKQAQKPANIRDFGFAVVNNTQKLIPYTQAVFWRFNNDNVQLEALSGNAVLDKNGPYAIKLSELIKDTLVKHTPAAGVISITKKDLSKQAQKNWDELFSSHGHLALFATGADGILGGLWLETNKPYTKAEIDILSELAESYSYSLRGILNTKKSISPFHWITAKKRRKWIALALLILFFLPTRLTITAPAEITAQSPKIVSAPYDGVLETINVTPGETVQSGQVIGLMDQTDIEAKVNQAQQALKTAQISLSKTGIESIRDQDSQKKADLQLLRSEIARKRIELEYAQTLFEKTEIKAPANGVAIFSDKNTLEGKPMHTGEKIMLIANPEEAELLVRIPIDTLLPIDKNSPLSFYLNVKPLKGYDAEINTIGYQASIDPDGLLTYKLRANIDHKEQFRIGWKGTAKIKSHWSIMGYALLRKPLIAIRNLLGL